jgi:hypothetical protein
VKTAPHLGHLIFASFETLAHPKENTANTANNIKMLTHFLITVHLLSSSFKKIAEKKTVYRKRITKIRFYVKQKIKISFFPEDIPSLTSFSSVWPLSPSSL